MAGSNTHEYIKVLFIDSNFSLIDVIVLINNEQLGPLQSTIIPNAKAFEAMLSSNLRSNLSIIRAASPHLCSPHPCQLYP
jgi:hypothetical protein